MVCAVMSGAIFKTKSLALVPALCIAHREEGAGEAGGGAAGADIAVENREFLLGKEIYRDRRNGKNTQLFNGFLTEMAQFYGNSKGVWSYCMRNYPRDAGNSLTADIAIPAGEQV